MIVLKRAFFILFALLIVSSCNQKKEQLNVKPDASRVNLPSSTGKLSELVIVIPNELWRSDVGAQIRAVFQEPLKGIPQKEAMFDIYNIEPKDFSSIFKTHKNILWVNTASSAGIIKEAQKWAKNQLFVNVEAKSKDELYNLLETKCYEIREWFYSRDLQRRLQALKNESKKSLEQQIKEAYGINIVIPKGYEVAESEEHFLWLRRDNPSVNIISNIWIELNDYVGSHQLSQEGLLAQRDSLGRVHVEGSRPQSFMVTERLYEPDFSLIQESPYTVESRGLWTMVNDFLGGSFIARATLNEAHNKVVYVEGFLYCPNERKRRHIQELEAVMSSISLN